MRRLLLFTVILFSSLISCDNCNCSNNQPYGEITLKVTINDENPEVFVTVFNDVIEKRDTVKAEWVSSSEIKYYMPAGNFYSATAYYYHNGRDYYAVDGKEMSVSSSSNCECDMASNIRLNLKLTE